MPPQRSAGQAPGANTVKGVPSANDPKKKGAADGMDRALVCSPSAEGAQPDKTEAVGERINFC